MTYKVEFSHEVSELKTITEREITDQEIFDALAFDETRLPKPDAEATDVEIAYLREWVWGVEELIELLNDKNDPRAVFLIDFMKDFDIQDQEGNLDDVDK